MMNNNKEQMVIGVDPSKQTVTLGPLIIQIKHPVFWKYFGCGAAIVGVATAIYVGLFGG